MQLTAPGRLPLPGSTEVQRQRGSPRRQPPVPDRRPDLFGRLVTDRRQKAHEWSSASNTARSRPKGIPQEVELLFPVLTPAAIVFAVDDPGLLRVQFQFAVLQPLAHGLQHEFGLLLARSGSQHRRRTARMERAESSAASTHRTHSA